MTRAEWSDLKAKAQAGDPEAQWEVGSWLEDGVKDPAGMVLARRNSRTAVGWFRKSAIAGNPSGQNHLGVCLSCGFGIRRNDVEALRWFRRAHRQGDSCAPINIACVYDDLGNHHRAMFWYRRAATLGDGDALVQVGQRYYTGTGVRRDPKRAVHCFHRAARHENISQAGRAQAMLHLGMAFHEGLGVNKSNGRAMQWLVQANRDGANIEARDLMERIARETRLDSRSVRRS